MADAYALRIVEFYEEIAVFDTFVPDLLIRYFDLQGISRLRFLTFKPDRVRLGIVVPAGNGLVVFRVNFNTCGQIGSSRSDEAIFNPPLLVSGIRSRYASFYAHIRF